MHCTGTTWGQLPAPGTYSVKVLRSRRGLRRSNRNRARKRTRVGTRISIFFNFPGFEPRSAPIIDLFWKKAARTGSILRPKSQGSCGTEKHAIVFCARKGTTGESRGEISWKTASHTLLRSAISRLARQHSLRDFQCSSPCFSHCFRRQDIVADDHRVHQ